MRRSAPPKHLLPGRQVMLRHNGHLDRLDPRPPTPQTQIHPQISQFPLPPKPYPTTTYKIPSTISAPKGTFIHLSQIPPHQHLTNYWTNRPCTKPSKTAPFLPPSWKSNTRNCRSQPRFHSGRSPQPVTRLPHPHIAPTANRTPLVAIQEFPPPPKNALLAVSVTLATVTTYQHRPAFGAHHTPECQHATPKQNM